ncbi:hypothetical protein [Mycolicibacterium neworleansense]|uniref:Uncharacterized protein n=1 Tax=Mycolicibacterium neworleansense TaxID=146018 RepID=A0A0H5RN82_9MYCO|nr:hypothetical protein [Mycolicibacterium neworleansense]MCV7364652.1 hypothetical protein [Mycolicibacterium neworleansense]CRZ15443.1 hypothetical protein BN2156_02304 [Mycolicibacterium neworleansense]
MTTHDEQTSAVRAEPTDVAEGRDTGAAGPAHEEVEPPQRAETEQTVEPEPPSDDNALLFADEHRTRLNSRWDEVQAAFVDDPKGCVQEADNLVSEVVDELTASFADTRSRLEAQWGRGEEASTEDLRLALQRYRDFFHRLLSV